MKKKVLSILLCLTMFCTGCGFQESKVLFTDPNASTAPTVTAAPVQTDIPDQTTEPVEETDPVSEKIDNMTLEEKIAQLFIVTPESITDVSKVIAAGEKTKEALQKYPVGGFIYFSQNIKTPTQLSDMTTNVQSYANEIEGMPLFLGVDEEGGKVARIGGNQNFDVSRYSDMRSIGDSGDTNEATKVGKTIGSYLNRYGLNLDFAPDADVITNPQNTVIGNRSFGTDAATVSKMVIAAAKGFESKGIFPCIKHFPGHGSTEGDTHEGFAYTKKSWNQLKKEEIKPFEAAVKENVPFIMVSHISVPSILGDNTPSTLSKKMVTTFLRKQLGYKGIIITDAMNMGAIIKNYNPEKAVILAFQAGADIILMPNNFKKAYQALLTEVKKGNISEKRIDESLYRIISLKQSM